MSTQNLIFAFGVLTAMVVLTMAATERFCQYRVRSGKPIAWWIILAGASFMPLLISFLGMYGATGEKGHRSEIAIELAVLVIICALPASVVVLRFKRQNKAKNGPAKTQPHSL